MSDNEAAQAVPAAKEKVCLCFRPEAEQTNFPEQWTYFMMPRAVVDNKENPDPTIQQFIPYVTFLRKVTTTIDGREAESFELLSYSRGKQSGEGRLVDNRSVGFGGHIDSMPGANFLEHLHNEISREIKEELGIALDSHRLYIGLMGAMRVSRLLHSRERPVDSVHTGLSVLLFIEEHLAAGQEFTLEAGCVEDLRWVSVEAMPAEQLAEYEVWSQIVIAGLANNLKEFRDAQEEARALSEQNRVREELREEINAINAKAEEEGDGAVTIQLNSPAMGDDEAWDYEHSELRLELVPGASFVKLYPLASIGSMTALSITSRPGGERTTYVFMVAAKSPEEADVPKLVLIDIRLEIVDLASTEAAQAQPTVLDGVNAAEPAAPGVVSGGSGMDHEGRNEPTEG